jgi:signal transduction histidine kinase
MLRRDPTKALQLGFLILLAISIATIGGWMTDHVRHGREVRARFQALYQAEAEAVTAFYAGQPSPAEIEMLLPHLRIDQSAHRAVVRPAALDELQRQEARRTTRFLWEGGFFLAVLLGGVAVLTRTIRHDAELRQRQQNFLAAVSHEFKSPLASMRLAAETLVLRSQEPDSQRLGRRILEDGERLLRMVDNLLDATRLEEGRRELVAEAVRLKPIADSSVAEIGERARLNDIAIRAQVPGELTVVADSTALESVLRNLLDNAVKACTAGHGHSITVTARDAGRYAEIEVKDDGIGFPPEDAAMIFGKFYRAGDEMRRTMPGTGLGLYIVKRLVELSRGRISAVSEGRGKGATVTVSWPTGAGA